MQINPPLLFAADPKKPETKAPATPPPPPTDEAIARVLAQQLGQTDLSKSVLLLPIDLTRDFEFYQFHDGLLEADVMQHFQDWLSKQPQRTLDVPPELLITDPQLQKKVDQGFRAMRAYYKNLFAHADTYLAAAPDPVELAERRLLELIRQARMFREAKIRELDAKRMASEAARRRTGLTPEISAALLASKTEMSALEEAMVRHNAKLFAGLTEFFRDETELRREFKPPHKILAIWLEDTKKEVAATKKALDAMRDAAYEVQSEFNMWTMMGRPAGEHKITGPLRSLAGAYLVQTSLNFRVAAVKSLEGKMQEVEALVAKEPPKVGKSSPEAPKLTAAEVLLKDLQELVHDDRTKRDRSDAYLYYRFSRGMMVVPAAGEQYGDTRRVVHPWLTALGWYRKNLEEQARAAGKPATEFRVAHQRGQKLFAAIGGVRPNAEKTEAEKRAESEAQRRRLTRPLKWMAAAGLSLGLALAGKNLAPHTGLDVELPFSIPFTSPVPGNSTTTSFSERPHVGQNFDLGTKSAENEEETSRPRYTLVPGSETHLAALPTEFEFAYLEERRRELTPYRFRAPAEERATFRLESEKEIRASDGWISLAHTPGYDHRAHITADGKELVPGLDYLEYVTPSGAHLAKLNAGHAKASLKVTNDYFPRAGQPNPIPPRELELNVIELNRLVQQADLMEAEGLTAWANIFRERVKAAKDGLPLKVTELPDLLRQGTYYPERGTGKVQRPNSQNPWSSLRDLPREDGKLVGQCSVSKEALEKLIIEVAPRFSAWITPMHVETRDADSPKVGKTFGHIYLVMKPPGYDAIKLDATSGDLHPKYRMPENENWAEFKMPWHSLGTGAAVLAAAAGGWYLRRRLRTLTPEEEQKAKEERAQTEGKGKTEDRQPASVHATRQPSPEEIALAELRARNEARRALAKRLAHVADRAVLYGESMGADPGRRDGSLPFPTTARVAYLMGQYVLGQTEHDTEEKLVAELARLFHFDEADRAKAGPKLYDVLTHGNRQMRQLRKQYLERFPNRADVPDMNAALFRELDETLKFIRNEKWTPWEREPLPPQSCPLKELGKTEST